MADEDELTQRDRRAMRHSKTRRTSTPGNLTRSVRRYAPLVIVLLAVAGAGVGVYYLSESGQQCVTDHWHATFGVYIPDEAGNPVRVDFGTPRTPGGLLYYDYSSTNLGGASAFSMTLHMHLTGAEAEGPASLGPAQFHMEQPGKCVGVRRALAIVEVEATSDSLRLFGGHEQVTGQSGTFTADGEKELRYWVQSLDRTTCQYGWHERSWSSVRNYQLQDGESLLVALGDYSDADIVRMQGEIPEPISRQARQRLCQIELNHSATTSAPAETSEPPAEGGNGTEEGAGETGTETGTETGSEGEWDSGAEDPAMHDAAARPDGATGQG